MKDIYIRESDLIAVLATWPATTEDERDDCGWADQDAKGPEEWGHYWRSFTYAGGLEVTYTTQYQGIDGDEAAFTTTTDGLCFADVWQIHRGAQRATIVHDDGTPMHWQHLRDLMLDFAPPEIRRIRHEDVFGY